LLVHGRKWLGAKRLERDFFAAELRMWRVKFPKWE
jgi:hypothetical protein